MSKKFCQLTEIQQTEVREEIRPQVEHHLAVYGHLLALADKKMDAEELLKAYHELEQLEEAEISQCHQAFSRTVKDPMRDLEKTIEDGQRREISLKSMLDEVVEICGLLEKPTKKVKTMP